MSNYHNGEGRKRDYDIIYAGVVMLMAMGMLAASAYFNYQKKVEKAQHRENLEQIIENRK